MSPLNWVEEDQIKEDLPRVREKVLGLWLKGSWGLFFFVCVLGAVVRFCMDQGRCHGCLFMYQTKRGSYHYNYCTTDTCCTNHSCTAIAPLFSTTLELFAYRYTTITYFCYLILPLHSMSIVLQCTQSPPPPPRSLHGDPSPVGVTAVECKINSGMSKRFSQRTLPLLPSEQTAPLSLGAVRVTEATAVQCNTCSRT